MVHEAYDRAVQLLEGRKQDLMRLGELLLKKELLLSDDMRAVLGPRPLGVQPPYKYSSVEEVDMAHAHDGDTPPPSALTPKNTGPEQGTPKPAL